MQGTIQARVFVMGVGVVIVSLTVWGVTAQSGTTSSVGASHAEIMDPPRQQVVESYGRLPLGFEPNRGQTDSTVKFLSRGHGYNLFLTSSEAVLVLGRRQGEDAAFGLPAGTERQGSAAAAVLRLQVVGANAAAEIATADELPGRSHYFRGNDPEQWLTSIPTYARIAYRNIYPGIDLVYHGHQGHLEYDFLVGAGADPQTITLAFQGAEEVALDARGDLLLKLSGTEVRQKKPFIYQESAGVRREVEGGYVFKGDGSIGFDVGDYDMARPLVIDPVVLAYSTYLGGSGFDFGLGVAVDGSGSAYVTGWTLSAGFPTTAQAFQASFGGGQDAFVSKVNPAGSALVYSTYLGGSGTDQGFDIALHGDGSAYVTGLTTSADFPTTMGAVQRLPGGSEDAFVTKLDRDGSALVYSTYLGGGATDFGFDIAIHPAGSVYLTGRTASIDFPTTASAVQPQFGGGAFDVFVAKLDRQGAELAYSTYLGGSDLDFGLGIAVDGGGSAYVTGWTLSADFPTTAEASQRLAGGGEDAFVSTLAPDGSALLCSTFLGGSQNDRGIAIAIDGARSAYVSGLTWSADFPTTEGALQTVFAGASGLNDAFLSKLERDGSALAYSTFLGGSGEDVALDLAVDPAGRAYVSGWTSSSDFPTTPGAFQAAFGGGGRDVFVTKLARGGSFLSYSTYLGGNDTEFAHGIAVDGAGSAYVTGQASSGFPTTPGALQPRLAGGPTDAFLAKMVEVP